MWLPTGGYFFKVDLIHRWLVIFIQYPALRLFYRSLRKPYKSSDLYIFYIKRNIVIEKNLTLDVMTAVAEQVRRPGAGWSASADGHLVSHCLLWGRHFTVRLLHPTGRDQHPGAETAGQLSTDVSNSILTSKELNLKWTLNLLLFSDLNHVCSSFY